MNIVIKKLEQKEEILNNMKIVHNVVNNIVLDLTKRMPDRSNAILQAYIDSMLDVVHSIKDGMELINFSIENENELILSNDNSLYLTGVHDYCDLIETKHHAAVAAIEKYKKDLEEAPKEQKKKSIWKTLIGLD